MSLFRFQGKARYVDIITSCKLGLLDRVVFNYFFYRDIEAKFIRPCMLLSIRGIHQTRLISESTMQLFSTLSLGFFLKECIFKKYILPPPTTLAFPSL